MKFKVILITVLLTVLSINSCSDSGIIESNKIKTPVEQSSLEWNDHTDYFSYDTLDSFDGCFYEDNVIIGSTRNILLSTDKGNTWVEKFLIPGTVQHIIKLQKLSNGIILAISRKNLFKSADGGINWINVLTSPFQLLNLKFVNENKGFLFGTDKKVTVTTDAGNTWTQLPDAPDYHGDVAYDGANKIYILNWGNYLSILDVFTLEYSKEQISNDNSDQIYKLNSVDGNLWANSLKSIYFKSAGSTIWQKIYSSDNDNITDISFINQNTGYACFFRNVSVDPWKLSSGVMKTTNGGISWEEDYMIENKRSGGLAYINAESENRVIACGATYIITKNK
jgi:hypothetical protein